MGKSTEIDAFSQYKGKGPEYRQALVRWFHNNRLSDFADFIESGDRLLSVGSGNAELESKILSERFDAVYTLELLKGLC